MLLHHPRVNKNIVNEYLDELVRVLAEHLVHQTHEYLEGIVSTNVNH
jgi:hypothetical protein